jgi:hypothetical protein
MKTLRFLACMAAIATSAACSSNGDPANSGPDGGDTRDGSDPDSASPDADPPPIACTTSATCPTASPCCLRTGDGGAYCAADPQTPGSCLCEKSSDCASGACALAVDSSGTPTGPNVCVPNDGAPYHGCTGNPSSCGVPYCCVADTNGNKFCALPCTSESTCGAAQCVPFDFTGAVYCNGGTHACGI